jgi:hypothetical protein
MERATKEAKLALVLSQRRTMCLNRLILPTACSMRARPLQRAREVLGRGDGVGLVRDDRDGATVAGGGAVGAAVVAFVGNRGAGRVGLLAAGVREGPVEVGLQVDFGGGSAS